jgi:hypothetical protein
MFRGQEQRWALMLSRGDALLGAKQMAREASCLGMLCGLEQLICYGSELCQTVQHDNSTHPVISNRHDREEYKYNNAMTLDLRYCTYYGNMCGANTIMRSSSHNSFEHHTTILELQTAGPKYYPRPPPAEHWHMSCPPPACAT